MKKLIILPLITMLSMSLLSIEQSAEAKKDKGEKHIKYKYKAPKNVTYRYIAPAKQTIIRYVPVTTYAVPLLTYRPGVYYFTTQSPAYISNKKAFSRGYKKSVVSFVNNRWVLTVR